MSYRYRETSSGATSRSLKRLVHLAKLGKILYVRAYRFDSVRTYTDENGNPYKVRIPNQECIIVRGEHGTARFGGFLWGYSGEGPRGLVQLLKQLGVNEWFAHDIARTKRHNTNGQDWRLDFHPQSGRPFKFSKRDGFSSDEIAVTVKIVA